MSIFLRLILAHFLGDFNFQTNTVFRIKSNYKYGVLFHISIIGVCFYVLSFPYLYDIKVWIILFILTISHALQDKIKLKFNSIEGPGSHDNLSPFLIDQFMHIGFIYAASVVITKITTQHNLINLPDFIESIYWNDKIIIIGIVYCIITYAANIFMAYLSKTLFNHERLHLHGMFMKYVRMFVRVIITTVFWIGGFTYLFLLIPVCLDYMFYKKRNIKLSNISLDFTFSLIAGLSLRLLLKSYIS